MEIAVRETCSYALQPQNVVHPKTEPLKWIIIIAVS